MLRAPRSGLAGDGRTDILPGSRANPPDTNDRAQSHSVGVLTSSVPRRPKRAATKRKRDWVDEVGWKMRSTAGIFFEGLAGVLKRYAAVDMAERAYFELHALRLAVPPGVTITVTANQRLRLDALRNDLEEAFRWAECALHVAGELRRKEGR